jgi:hypothetical protein
VVERQLPKLNVVGSIPIARSSPCAVTTSGRVAGLPRNSIVTGVRNTANRGLHMRNRLSMIAVVLAALAMPMTAPAQTGTASGAVRLDPAEQMILSEDIRDPDRYLDELIARSQDSRAQQAELQKVKALGRDAKVKWLLDQRIPEGFRVVPALAPVATCVLVTITVTVAVVVGYELYQGARRAIIEYQERQQQV